MIQSTITFHKWGGLGGTMDIVLSFNRENGAHCALVLFWPTKCTSTGMAIVNSADFSQRHYACADMVRVDCDSASELAVLLEIWEGGGVVQTSFPIAAGSPIAIAVEKTEVMAQVTKCQPDQDFGYLIDIDVTAPTKWFPRAYVPAWHSPELASALGVGIGNLAC